MLSAVQNFSYFSANPQSAADYDKNATIQQDRALENLTGWSFNETDLVLDLGSGNGRITANIAKQVPYGQVIGLDIDPQMCQYATDNYQYDENPNLEFKQGNACELNYDEEFNKITSFATLSWIPIANHHQIFTGIARALKPHGKALLRMSAQGDRPWNKVIEDIVKDIKWNSFFSGFVSPASYQSEEGLRSLICNTELQIIRLEDATKISSFLTKKAFYEWLMTWEPHRHQVPKQLTEQFFHEAIDRYCEKMCFKDEITITLPGILIEVEKIKKT